MPRIPLNVAIVGSGPSGFYAADALFRSTDLEARVDVYERLATPWGLVRSGVAPDHPKIKSVSTVYTRIAAHESFRFFGNVEVGTHVTRRELAERYDAVIYAVGTQGDRKLGIPGEELPGSVGAVDFVGWYNGHPDRADLAVDLSCERAVVIGNGNVALDVARILCTPVERLARTDIADHALAALLDSAVKEVVVVGRRGAAQAAFTTPELMELPELTEAQVVVDPDDLVAPCAEAELSKAAVRNLNVMRRYADVCAAPGARRLVLRFLRSPVEIRGDGKVEEIVLGRNELRIDPAGAAVAWDTGQRETARTGLVVRAVGYRGMALDGLPFDPRTGVVPHVRGRVVGGEREYVVGWIKRGPSGTIGTNKKDSAETVAQLVADLHTGALRPLGSSSGGIGMAELLGTRRSRVVTQQNWEMIDRQERESGLRSNRPRVKICDREALLEAAFRAPASSCKARAHRRRVEFGLPEKAPGEGV